MFRFMTKGLLFWRRKINDTFGWAKGFIISLEVWRLSGVTPRLGTHCQCLFLLPHIVLWLTLRSAVLMAGQGVPVGNQSRQNIKKS